MYGCENAANRKQLQVTWQMRSPVRVRTAEVTALVVMGCLSRASRYQANRRRQSIAPFAPPPPAPPPVVTPAAEAESQQEAAWSFERRTPLRGWTTAIVAGSEARREGRVRRREWRSGGAVGLGVGGVERCTRRSGRVEAIAMGGACTDAATAMV